MIDLSIIVPVYNSKKHITTCLESLVSQSLKNIEIIIINDGSTDGCESIVKTYVKKYPNLFRYYEKENEGVAEARNLGISYVKGEYFAFVDSDDCIDKNIYYNLKQYMEEKIELIKFKMKIVENKKIQIVDGPVFDKCSGEEAFNKLVSVDKLLESPCIYLFKKNFWLENKFEFCKNTYHEDFGLIPFVILNAKSVISTNEIGYNYIQSNESIMRTSDYIKTLKKAKDILTHYDNMIAKIKNYDISEKTANALKRYFTNALLIKIPELKNDEQKQFIIELKKRKIYKNITILNKKQFIKRYLIKFNPRLYIKMR